MVTVTHKQIDQKYHYFNFSMRWGILHDVKRTIADHWCDNNIKKYYDMAVIKNVNFNGNHHIKPLNRW